MRLSDVDLKDICTAPVAPQDKVLTETDKIFYDDNGSALKQMPFDDFAENLISNYQTSFGNNTQSVKQAIQQIKSSDISDKTVDFDMAEDREDIVRGDSLATLFGKIKKWFNDLKSGAFLPVKNNLTTTESNQGVLDAHQGKVLNDKITPLVPLSGYTVADNLNVTAGGNKVLDAHQGNVLYVSISDLDTYVKQHINKLLQFENKSIINHLAAKTSGNVLDAHQGRRLWARFDYAYWKSSEYTWPYSITANQYMIIENTTTDTNYSTENSYYFEKVTQRISGTLINCIKIKKSGKYMMISQCFFTRNPNVSDTAKYEVTLGLITNNSETPTKLIGGANGIGKGGCDIHSLSFATLDANSVYALYMKRSDSVNVQLYTGKVVLIPTFFSDDE